MLEEHQPSADQRADATETASAVELKETSGNTRAIASVGTGESKRAAKLTLTLTHGNQFQSSRGKRGPPRAADRLRFGSAPTS
jgi:hypothetical protein